MHRMKEPVLYANFAHREIHVTGLACAITKDSWIFLMIINQSRSPSSLYKPNNNANKFNQSLKLQSTLQSLYLLFKLHYYSNLKKSFEYQVLTKLI